MSLVQACLFPILWIGYLVYWWAMAMDVKATRRSEPMESRLTRMLSIVCALMLLWRPSVPLQVLNGRFLPLSDIYYWSGAAIASCGFLFSIWARRHLGRNWSQAVTVKEDHELVTTGPYAVVRHPIYTGLLLAFLGSAVARGEWRGLVAVALVFAVLWRKLKLEEKWMSAEFGESYAAYCRRVSALVPFIR
jgi:protein-S-isoprenylcysteine O-methyltransferase Ste14